MAADGNATLVANDLSCNTIGIAAAASMVFRATHDSMLCQLSDGALLLWLQTLPALQYTLVDTLASTVLYTQMMRGNLGYAAMILDGRARATDGTTHYVFHKNNYGIHNC